MRLFDPVRNVSDLTPRQIASVAFHLAVTDILLTFKIALTSGVVLLLLAILWHAAAVVVFWLAVGIILLLQFYTLVTGIAPWPFLVIGKIAGKVNESWSALGWYGLGSLARLAAIAVDVAVAWLVYRLFVVF